VVIGKKKPMSPSIYPDDPESSHFDPSVSNRPVPGGL
jgi:hypothetical protein